MKKILLIVMLWTMVLPSVIAQDSVVVKFMVEIPKEQKLTAQQSGELKDKMEAVLGRMDAHADASEYVLADIEKQLGNPALFWHGIYGKVGAIRQLYSSFFNLIQRQIHK